MCNIIYKFYYLFVLFVIFIVCNITIIDAHEVLSMNFLMFKNKSLFTTAIYLHHPFFVLNY